jgi:hypothetical protein
MTSRDIRKKDRLKRPPPDRHNLLIFYSDFCRFFAGRPPGQKAKKSVAAGLPDKNRARFTAKKPRGTEKSRLFRGFSHFNRGFSRLFSFDRGFLRLFRGFSHFNRGFFSFDRGFFRRSRSNRGFAANFLRFVLELFLNIFKVTIVHGR